MSCEARHIAIGLADSNRETLSTLLSLLEDTEVVGIALASARDAAQSAKANFGGSGGNGWKEEARSATVRIEAGAARIRESQDSTELLRLRVWLHIRDGFELEQERFPIARSTDVFQRWGMPTRNTWRDWLGMKKHRARASSPRIIGSTTASTSLCRSGLSPWWNIISDKPSRSRSNGSLRAWRRGRTPKPSARLETRAVEYLEALDEKHKSELLAAANVEEISRESAMKILALQGTLVGTGVATELAGFSAYMLAAKASAIIPLVGGKTLVSTLAVLSNPVFIVPAYPPRGRFLRVESGRRHPPVHGDERDYRARFARGGGGEP